MFLKINKNTSFNQFTQLLKPDNVEAFFIDGNCKASVFTDKLGYTECYISSDTGSLFYANIETGEYNKY